MNFGGREPDFKETMEIVKRRGLQLDGKCLQRVGTMMLVTEWKNQLCSVKREGREGKVRWNVCWVVESLCQRLRKRTGSRRVKSVEYCTGAL